MPLLELWDGSRKVLLQEPQRPLRPSRLDGRRPIRLELHHLEHVEEVKEALEVDEQHAELISLELVFAAGGAQILGDMEAAPDGLLNALDNQLVGMLQLRAVLQLEYQALVHLAK